MLPTTATSGNSTGNTQEVSVAITTIPTISTPTNVYITDVSSDINDDEFDFKKLSRQNSTASATELLTSIRSKGDTPKIVEPPRSPNFLTTSSAPTTLTKQKSEPKTGEVYV